MDYPPTTSPQGSTTTITIPSIPYGPLPHTGGNDASVASTAGIFIVLGILLVCVFKTKKVVS